MHNTPSAHPRRARRARFLGLCLAAWRGSVAAAGPQADMVELDLPAGPLGATLVGIGRSAGALVSFKPGLVGPHQAPALHGRFTLQQALRLALGSSGLAFQITPSGVVTVVDRASSEP
jgi:hypothetical protein